MAENIDIGTDDAQAWADKSNVAIDAVNGIITQFVIIHADDSYEFTDTWDEIIDGGLLVSGDTVLVPSGTHTISQRHSSDANIVGIDNLSIIGVGMPLMNCLITGATASQSCMYIKDCHNLYIYGLVIRAEAIAGYTGANDIYTLHLSGNSAVDRMGNALVENCTITQVLNAGATGSEALVFIEQENQVVRNCRISTLNKIGTTNINLISIHDSDIGLLDNCRFAREGDVGFITGDNSLEPIKVNCYDSGGIVHGVGVMGVHGALSCIADQDKDTFDDSDTLSGITWTNSNFVQATVEPAAQRGSGTGWQLSPTGPTNVFFDVKSHSGGSPASLIVRIPILWDSAITGDIRLRVGFRSYSTTTVAGAATTAGGYTTFATPASTNQIEYIELTVPNTGGNYDETGYQAFVARDGDDILDTATAQVYIMTPQYRWVRG